MGIKISILSPKKTRNTVESSIDKKQCSSELSDGHLTSTSYDRGTSYSAISDESMLINGRRFHGVSNSAYWFPNDNEEMDRLVGQHFALKTLFNGNIHESIIKGIEVDRMPARILDVGCGPGTWIMDIATEYPQSQFTGIDLCDVFPTNIRPPNVTFQIANILESLPFPDETFDCVNMRLFIIALKKHEWPQAIKEVYRVLKPGGYIQMTECNMLDKGTEYVKHIGEIFKEFIESRGQEPYIASQIPALLESQQFQIIDLVVKDAYLGQPNPLSREFLCDVLSIFKTARIPFQEILQCNPEDFPQIIEKFCKECQKQPDAIWSFSLCVGQK